MVLPNDDFDVDAKIIRPAENFDHAAHAVFAIGGELNHLDVDDKPLQLFHLRRSQSRAANAVDVRGRGRELHARWNANPIAKAIVVRLHPVG